MAMFAKWFFGFSPERVPVITFSQQSSRDALLKMAKAGDVIVYVGTKGEATPDEYKGRVLGAAEIGRKAVRTEEVVDASLFRELDFENGEFRWPEGIPMLRAWRFEPPPLASEVFEHGNLPHNAQTQAVKLSKGDQQAVKALNWVEVVLPETVERERQRRMVDAFRQKPTLPGPVVEPGTYIVTVEEQSATWTYAAQFGHSNVWKIGRTGNVESRLKELNAHVPHEYLCEAWSLKLQQRWPTPNRAQEMEQRVLALLVDKRTFGERVRCSFEELEGAWVDAISGRE
ncbi:MAG: GIY-YIG nuclease family protein [Hyphomicrobiales bacterium]|nr:GIY-YIG nuclease family protein [Hyphomicrobiales bacterium]